MKSDEVAIVIPVEGDEVVPQAVTTNRKIVARICAIGHERITYYSDGLCPLCTSETVREQLVDRMHYMENELISLKENAAA